MDTEIVIGNIGRSMQKRHGISVRLLKGEYDVSSKIHECILVVGLRYGHSTWYEFAERPVNIQTILSALKDVPDTVMDERVEHHAYQMKCSFSEFPIERDGQLFYDMMADQLCQWWRVQEELEQGERSYNALNEELREYIGYFVDEPRKQLDLSVDADRWMLLAYRQLQDVRLVSVNVSLWGDRAVAHISGKGEKVIKYLIAQRKKEAKDTSDGGV